MRLTLFIALLAAPVSVGAQDVPEGEVQIPLEVYNQLVQRAAGVSRPAPVGYAVGQAEVNVTVTEVGNRATAQVQAVVSIDVLEGQWVLVPVLPAGTSVSAVTIDGDPVQLVTTPAGLAWGTKESGSYAMSLSYSVDALRSGAGTVLAVPAPAAAAIRLNATLPGTNLDVGVIPASGVRTSPAGNTTQVSATVPTTSGIHISWRAPAEEGHVVSRAAYRGTLDNDAVVWTGELSVDLLGSESVTLALLPRTVTLSDVRVDNREASILVEGERFATLIKGRGRHKVSVSFQVPVSRAGGPPHVDLQIPRVPVSRFDLTLPGRKNVTVTPVATVSTRRRTNTTEATVFVPMTDRVTLSWNEAVLEAVKEELRATAQIVHAAYAEEGVLHVRAMVVYEVTSGETNVINFETPAGVEVNEVSAPAGGVETYQFNRGGRGRPGSLKVVLNRQLKKESFTLEIRYEVVTGTGARATQKIDIPLLKATGVYRQRGMVALLASKELTLKPVDEKRLARVGENQLPAFVRQAIDMTIAHTYKYIEEDPALAVEPTKPERVDGKFDAEVNTLISLSDVTLKGSATVEVNVKSGSIMELQLELPAGVNLLDRAAPSLRNHEVIPGEGDAPQTIDLQFTQEMEGQFRVKVTYERILADGESEVTVPTIRVRGAEVEQGRIAVEALTAVEVQASVTEQLSSLDISELPQQLILETTNPILLAYKYVHVDPPYTLGLHIARHQELDVQSATIDEAQYRTLFTRDGLAVTTAQFVLRNSRKQFLKVELPRDSEIWSVFVNGAPEKPALQAGSEKNGNPNVLIKIINSSEGFPVDVIYKTPVDEIGLFGNIGGRLPRPDMVVTHSAWDVYLPDGLTYGSPRTEMDVVETGVAMTGEEMQSEVDGAMDPGVSGQMVEPLRISVPTSGIRFRFEKLYANQSDAEAEFAVPYASGGGTVVAHLLTLAGAVLLWAGVFFLALRRKERWSFAVGAAATGLVLLLVTVGYLGTSPMVAILVSIAAAVVLASIMGRDLLRKRHQSV